MSVAVYPKAYVEQLYRETEKLKEDIDKGNHPVFDNVEALFDQPEEQ